MRNEDRFEDIVRKDLDVRASDGTYDRMRDIVYLSRGDGTASWRLNSQETARRSGGLRIQCQGRVVVKDRSRRESREWW